MKHSVFVLSLIALFSVVSSATVTVLEGPVNFWFLDCQSTLCTELEVTKHMNAVKDEVVEVTIPSITELRLFVQCLNEETACSVKYETQVWESTVEVPAKESSTFVASNSVASLAVEMSPEYYNTEGDVEVTLTFTSESTPEPVELTAADLTIKNGQLNGDLIKVEDHIYRFTVTPVSKSSFVILLPRSFVSSNGLSIRSGLIHGCMFDEEAPYLLNTQYRSGLIDDRDEKTILVALNEPASVVSFEGVVQSVQVKTGFINTFEIVVKGSGDATVVFRDAAGNEFTFTTPVVFNVASEMVVLEEPAFNSTLPVNGRLEFVFNHFVQLPEEVKEATLANGENTLSIRLDVYRYVRIQQNRVVFFLEPSRMNEGVYTLSIPEGAFVSEEGMLSPAVESTFVVVSKTCNTNYVVGGMRGEKCKCFSVGDQCQCTCGETHFSRDF